MQPSQIQQALRASLIQDGVLVSSRIRQSWVDKNLTDIVNPHLIDLFSMVFAPTPVIDFDVVTKIKIVIFDCFYTPICKTCRKPHFKWQKQKNRWSEYCSMKCCQNDVAVKEKVISGLKSVDWESAIEKRESTMKDRYGVVSASQLDSTKEKIASATKRFYSDASHVSVANSKRKETNMQRYGVAYLSQDKQRQAVMVAAAVSTKASKSDSQRKTVIDRCRQTKLGDSKYYLLSDGDNMRKLYVHDGLRIGEIATLFSVSWDAVKYALKRHEIEIDYSRENGNRSAKENMLFRIIKDFCPDAVQGMKIQRKEIDIFIPSKNIGIELNGVYWHSHVKKHSGYHAEKRVFFADKGIRLIQIWEDDLDNRQDVVVNFIKNAIGCNKAPRFAARKTRVDPMITSQEYAAFLDENHMQGNSNCKIRIGLRSADGELIAVMGFDPVQQNVENHEGAFYLTRFASKPCNGAFTKMLKFFIMGHSEATRIVSFANLDLVDPNKNVYAANGFMVSKELAPDYSYYNPSTKQREHKFKWRKDSLTKIGGVGETEFEMAVSVGFNRCYDSGKLRYELTISKNP